LKAPHPTNEQSRLQALKQYEILDTADEIAFDDLVVLAASICQVPMAYISLIDEDRQWFKARIGVGYRDTDRNLSFCAHAILKPDQMTIVNDMSRDLRFCDNDLVIGKPNIHFYAGVPLVNADGIALGALAVLDKVTRSLSVDQTEMLRALARQVVAQLELRRFQNLVRHQADQLLQVKGVQSAAERAKQAFLSNISHEFRTPINGIVGITSLLATTPLSERQLHYVDTIEKSADQLLLVLTDILEFTKHQVLSPELHVTKLDLGKIMDSVASIMKPMAIAKQLRFESNVDPNLRSELMGDGLRIQQVLTNLVGNALKFTSTGFVEMEASQVTSDADGSVVRFEVRDSGIGIPTEMQTRVFDEFTQVEEGSERRFSGAGLGLSICRQVTKQLGAQICVASEPGVGSRFWFDLVMPFEESYHRSKASPSALEQQVIQKGRVLVVEDNEISSIVLATLLEKLGCDVTSVSRGNEALDQLEEKRFDVIFMDVQVPDLTGIHTTKAIRRLSFPTNSTPIIAISASVTQENEEICLAAGMNDLISKPVSEKVISRTLSRWLKHVESKTLV